MRRAIIIGRRKDREDFRVLSGPEVPFSEQLERFKGDLPEGIVEMEFWTNNQGATKRRRGGDRGTINAAGTLTVAEQKRQAKESAEAHAAAAEEASAKAEADEAEKKAKGKSPAKKTPSSPNATAELIPQDEPPAPPEETTGSTETSEASQSSETQASDSDLKASQPSA